MGKEENVMADDDLPPSLRASGDVPPSMRTPDQTPPSMRSGMVSAPMPSRPDPMQATFEQDKNVKAGEEVPAEGKAFMAAESAAGGYYLPQLPGQIIRGAKALGELPKTVEEAMNAVKTGGGAEEFPRASIEGDKIVKAPWDMTKEEFSKEEAKGMGISWQNAVKDDNGNIHVSNTAEHGDMVPKLRDQGLIGDEDKPQYRGWVWKGLDKDKTFIDVGDLQKSGGDFHQAYLNKKPEDPKHGSIADIFKFEKEPGTMYHGTALRSLDSILKQGEIRPNISADADNIMKEHPSISLSREPKIAECFGNVVFHVKEDKVPDAYEAEKMWAQYGDKYKGIEHRLDRPIPLKDVDKVTIQLGSKEGMDYKFAGSKTVQEYVDDLKSRGIQVDIQKPQDPRDVLKQVAKDSVEKVLPQSSKSAEHLAIDAETAGSQAPRALGVPSAMVDSSSKLKGTETAPALKPEIIPGTRAWSTQIWQRLVTPAAKAIAAQGPSGQSLAADIIKVRDVPSVRYGMEFGAGFEELYNQLPKKFVEQVGNEIQMSLENKSFESDLPSDVKIIRSKLAEEAKNGLKRISDWAQIANDGKPIKIHRTNGDVVDWAPRGDYYPRWVKTDILEDIVRGQEGRMKQLAQHLLDSRQAPNSQAAMEQVRNFRKGLLDRKFGHIERSREMDLPPMFYETNAFKVIPQYMKTAYQRLSEVETFGLNDHKAIGKIMNIAHEGGDEDLAIRSYRRITGRDPVDAVAKGMFSALRNWATGSMIQFQTTLYHLPRTLYPALEAGFLKSFKGLWNAIGESGDLEATRMGVNLSRGMSEFLQEEYGGGKGVSGKFAQKMLTLEGIKPLDRFDRKYSAIVGKDYIENDLVKTLLKKPGNSRAREGLQSLGIDTDKILANKKIDPLDLNVGAKRFSDRWQGAPDPTRLPMWATTNPIVHSAFQFKNFIYVISREMGGSIARAARTGDMATLARFGSLPMAGGVVYGIRHEMGLHDTKYVDDPKLNQALNVLRDSAPLPIGVDVVFKILQGRRGVNDMMTSMFPSINAPLDLLGDVGETIKKGKMDKQTKKDFERHIPGVGTFISHT